MNRRSLLSGLATATVLAPASGCLGAGGAGGDGTTDAHDTDGSNHSAPNGTDTSSASGTPTETDDAVPTISNRQLRRTGDCPAEDAGTASVTFGTDAVTVTGCITGRNGCQRAALAGAEYDAEQDTLTVAVTTNEGEDAPDVCSQQLVHRAYTATITFERGLPGTVSVVHESRGERSEVARASCH